MKYSTFLLRCAAILLVAQSAAHAVEQTSWGALKMNWEGTAAAAAKLTISSELAGAYRPGSVRFIMGSKEEPAAFINTLVEDGVICGSNELEFLVTGNGEPVDIAPLGPVSWRSINCISLETGVFTSNNGVLTTADGDQVFFSQVWSNLVPAGFDFWNRFNITGGTGKYAGVKGTATNLGNCNFDEAGNCPDGASYITGWISGIRPD